MNPQSYNAEVWVAATKGFSTLQQGTLALNNGNLALEVGPNQLINAPIQNLELKGEGWSKFLIKSGDASYRVRFIELSRFTGLFETIRAMKNRKAFIQALAAQSASSLPAFKKNRRSPLVKVLIGIIIFIALAVLAGTLLGPAHQ
jgi:hypothetical protein